MDMDNSRETRHSLLGRALQLDDHAAWQELHDHYAGFIHYILQRARVSATDANDLVQEVMINLMKNLKNYDVSKGRFRSWLAIVTRSTLKIHYRKIQSVEKKHDRYKNHMVLFEEQDEVLDKMIEKQWETYISEKALARVEKTIRGRAIEVFRLSLSGMKTKEIAERLDLQESSVYNFRQRVQRKLKLEIRSLVEELESEVVPVRSANEEMG